MRPLKHSGKYNSMIEAASGHLRTHGVSLVTRQRDMVSAYKGLDHDDFTGIVHRHFGCSLAIGLHKCLELCILRLRNVRQRISHGRTQPTCVALPGGATQGSSGGPNLLNLKYVHTFDRYGNSFEDEPGVQPQLKFSYDILEANIAQSSFCDHAKEIIVHDERMFDASSVSREEAQTRGVPRDFTQLDRRLKKRDEFFDAALNREHTKRK